MGYDRIRIAVSLEDIDSVLFIVCGVFVLQRTRFFFVSATSLAKTCLKLSILPSGFLEAH